MWLLVLAYIRVLKPWILLNNPDTVVNVREERGRGRTWTLTLEPAKGSGMKFSPGQFA